MIPTLSALSFALGIIAIVYGISKVDTSRSIDFTPGAFRELDDVEKKNRNNQLWTDVLSTRGLNRVIILAGLVVSIVSAVILAICSVS